MRGPGLALFFWVLPACEDREDCDNALDVVCSCDSHPCEAKNPPAIVRALRRCDEDDVRPDNQEGNVHLCIQGAGSDFCAVLDGVIRKDQSLCSANCELYSAACTVDLSEACYDYQFSSCDVGVQ